MYEFYYDIQSTIEGLKRFVGFCLHLSGCTPTHRVDNPKQAGLSILGFGIDAVIGIDYKLDALPFDISVDWQRSINLTSNA